MKKLISFPFNGQERPLEIRWSTDDDARKIYEWLKEEARLGVHGNFLWNWNLTQQCHHEGTLLVLVDVINDAPIGYQWNQLLKPGILQIRHEWRRVGLGRLIVEHCIELAQQQNEVVLSIECKPSSSIPFWKSMGFTIIKDGHSDNATGYKVLTKKFDLPNEGMSTDVRISSFPKERQWREDVSPIDSFSPQAVRGPNGIVYLAERAAFPNVNGAWRDLVIEIIIDGCPIYRGRANGEKAQSLGVQECKGGFYIDSITFQTPC